MLKMNILTFLVSLKCFFLMCLVCTARNMTITIASDIRMEEDILPTHSESCRNIGHAGRCGCGDYSTLELSSK